MHEACPLSSTIVILPKSVRYKDDQLGREIPLSLSYHFPIMMISTTIFLFSAMAGSFASATPSRYRRSSPDNTVVVDSAEKFW